MSSETRRLSMERPDWARRASVVRRAAGLAWLVVLLTTGAGRAPAESWNRAPIRFVGQAESNSPVAAATEPLPSNRVTPVAAPLQPPPPPAEMSGSIGASLPDPSVSGHALPGFVPPADYGPPADFRAEPGLEGGDNSLSPPAEQVFVAPLGPNAAWFNSPSPTNDASEFVWQTLPDGLLYQSYLAGEKEPRISSAWLSDENGMSDWEVTLGGRVGLLRYGTLGAEHPQGFQVDVEGAALVRLNPDFHTDVDASDYRFGSLLTWREGPLALKTGYYHISAHVGDEFLVRNPGYKRINYVRDSAIIGAEYDLTPSIRVYSEAAYAIGHEGGALPLEFQYGAEYSSTQKTWWAPYAAINGHTREDRNWITSVNIVGGMQVRGLLNDRRLRIGFQYYEGPALQYSFVGQHERLIGTGLWFDY